VKCRHSRIGDRASLESTSIQASWSDIVFAMNKREEMEELFEQGNIKSHLKNLSLPRFFLRADSGESVSTSERTSTAI
jgi:hypothetical protein